MQLLTRIFLNFGNNSYTPTVYAKRRDSKSRYIATAAGCKVYIRSFILNTNWTPWMEK